MSVPTHRLAVVASALSEDARAATRMARQCGFAGIAFDVYAPGLSLPELSLSGRREFARLVAAQDMKLSAVRMDTGRHGIGPGADADREISRIARALDVAAGLGAPVACIDIGPLPAPARQEKPRPAIDPAEAGLIIIPAAQQPLPQPAPRVPEPVDTAAMAQVDSVLKELGQRADRFGVVLAFRSELSSFAALERALTAANCPWFGIDLDPVAVLRDEWGMDEAFSRLAAQVRHVRLRDALAGGGGRTKPAPIGQGSVNWEELLANLDQTGYSGWLEVDTIELPNRAAGAQAALSYLAGS